MRWNYWFNWILFVSLVVPSWGATWEHATELPGLVPDQPTSALHPDHGWSEAGRLRRKLLANSVSVLSDVANGRPAHVALSRLTELAENATEELEARERAVPAETMVRISSRFGMRFHPILRRWRLHNGVDYAAPRGTPILAVASGEVTFAGWSGGAGRLVKIQHDGYESAYAHLSRIPRGIEEGTQVAQGQVIGKVGASGLATGHHLHFSIKVDGRFVDPFLDGQDRIEPIEDAQFWADLQKGVTNTLTTIHVSTVDMFTNLADIPEEESEAAELWFDDTFL